MVEMCDEEEYTYLKLEMYNADDMAQNGEHAKIVTGEYDELPSPEIIAKEVMKSGFDTFEVTHVTEKTKRYNIDLT